MKAVADTYFDHCASSPMYPVVIDTIAELMKLHYANASALHRSGQEASRLLERARDNVARLLGATPGEVIFTSGGTESNNLAIHGCMNIAKRKAKHMITTEIEHASVYQCMRQLEERGIEITILPVNRHGRVDPDDVARAIRKDTVLVSVMHVNNETGTVQPIEEIGALLTASPHVKFHVDGVQAIGKVPWTWANANIHYYSISAHKFRGPKGSGLLLVREGTELAPLFAGGGQERGLRSGTSNVPVMVGTAQALRLALKSMPERREKLYALRKRLLTGVATIPQYVVNGIGADDNEQETAPHIVNLSYPGIRPEVMVHMLEQEGILLSTQSACSSKSLKPSRVLLAMGYSEERASGSIRISMGDEHGDDDVDLLIQKLRIVADQLQPLERGRK